MPRAGVVGLLCSASDMPQWQRTAAIGLIAFVFVVTGAQSILRGLRLDALANRPKPDPVACRGEPIIVNDNFYGGSLKPWSCKERCEEGQSFYLLYLNGRGTQCGAYPNCFDQGEDDGITCIPPLTTPAE